MPSSLKILVVEDNDDLRDTTHQILTDEGHQVTAISSAEELPESYDQFNLALIDLNLPGEDGIALARRMRKIHPKMGLIMVTARRLPEDRTRGYQSGADIYLVKPVGLEELMAAIAALSRRLQDDSERSGIRLVRQGLYLLGEQNTRVSLLAHEAELLSVFSAARNQQLEQYVLIELMGKERAADPKAALELQILRLRKKLKQAGAQDPIIQSIRGWGYQLCVELVID